MREGPLNEFVVSFTPRVEASCGGCDDTALNGFKMDTKAIPEIVGLSFDYTLPEDYDLAPQSITSV